MKMTLQFFPEHPSSTYIWNSRKLLDYFMHHMIVSNLYFGLSPGSHIEILKKSSLGLTVTGQSRIILISSKVELKKKICKLVAIYLNLLNSSILSKCLQRAHSKNS